MVKSFIRDDIAIPPPPSPWGRNFGARNSLNYLKQGRLHDNRGMKLICFMEVFVTLRELVELSYAGQVAL